MWPFYCVSFAVGFIYSDVTFAWYPKQIYAFGSRVLWSPGKTVDLNGFGLGHLQLTCFFCLWNTCGFSDCFCGLFKCLWCLRFVCFFFFKKSKTQTLCCYILRFKKSYIWKFSFNGVKNKCKLILISLLHRGMNMKSLVPFSWIV